MIQPCAGQVNTDEHGLPRTFTDAHGPPWTCPAVFRSVFVRGGPCSSVCPCVRVVTLHPPQAPALIEGLFPESPASPSPSRRNHSPALRAGVPVRGGGSMKCRSFFRPACLVLLGILVLSVGAFAIEPEDSPSYLGKKAFFKPELYISSSHQPV